MSKTNNKGPKVEPRVTPQMLDFEENSLKMSLIKQGRDCKTKRTSRV